MIHSEKRKDDSANPPWWKGHRGEWFVVAQIGLFILVIFGPPTHADLPAWAAPYRPLCSAIGFVLMLMGAAMILAGFFKLGRNLTPLPYPKDNSELIDSGPYRLVRHPIYSGGIMMAYGWALWIHGWLTLFYATILFIFLDVKSRREEVWLKDKFPTYPDYQKRVHKLIPFIY